MFTPVILANRRCRSRPCPPRAFPFARFDTHRRLALPLQEFAVKIHEYQGKEIFRRYGMAVPRGVPAFTVEEAVKAAQSLGGAVWVVKAQIHAGGRGKGGGVKLARSLDEVRQYASQILGMQLVTHQTGPAG